MKTKTATLTTVVAMLFLGALVSQSNGQSDEQLTEIEQLLGRNLAEEALPKAKALLNDWKASELPADHPDIGRAAVMAGMAASMAGKHEEAAAFFAEGLPLISGPLRGGVLMIDELQWAMTYVSSLRQLDKDELALEVLEDLLKRTREGINRRQQGPESTLLGTNAQGEKFDGSAGLPNAQWLITLLGTIGSLHGGAERWAEAENTLAKAIELWETHFPEQNENPAADLRRQWQDAMRRQGKVIRPDLVGRFSNPRALKIRGADQISEEEIFSALARSGRFLMASHPNEALGKFLRTLEQCLVDGYQASGFPEVTVKADWQDAEETIVVAITEGPRFNAGNVIIKGMRTVSQEALLEALLTKDDKERQPVDRGETFYQAMLEAKRLPPISLKDGFTEAFPYLFDENLEIIDTEEFDLSTFPTMEEDPPFFHFWEPGQWADYRSSTLEQAKFVTQNVYQWEKGLLWSSPKKVDMDRTDRSVSLGVFSWGNSIRRMKENMLLSSYIQADETPITCLNRTHPKGSRSVILGLSRNRWRSHL